MHVLAQVPMYYSSFQELAMELLRCLMESKKLFSRVSSYSTSPSSSEAAAVDASHHVACGNIPTHSASPSSNHLPLLRHLCNVSFR